MYQSPSHDVSRSDGIHNHEYRRHHYNGRLGRLYQELVDAYGVLVNRWWLGIPRPILFYLETLTSTQPFRLFGLKFPMFLDESGPSSPPSLFSQPSLAPAVAARASSNCMFIVLLYFARFWLTCSVRIQFRWLQGIGGCGVLALGQLVFFELVPPRKYPVYIALVTAVVALSLVVGPLIGGGITLHGDWRWVFLLKYDSLIFTQCTLLTVKCASWRHYRRSPTLDFPSPFSARACRKVTSCLFPFPYQSRLFGLCSSSRGLPSSHHWPSAGSDRVLIYLGVCVTVIGVLGAMRYCISGLAMVRDDQDPAYSFGTCIPMAFLPESRPSGHDPVRFRKASHSLS